MARRAGPTSRNAALVLSACYEVEVQTIAERDPCPLPLEVDVCVLMGSEARGEDSRSIDGWCLAVEWPVFDWYPGHVMNDAGTPPKHDGRTPNAQSVLLQYALSSDGRQFFVDHITDFLWAAILFSARAQVQGRTAGAAILNVRCEHGRHRSLGWAYLTLQVLLLLGVRVKLLIPQERLCRCRHCNYAIDPRRLQGISTIATEIELNLVERSKGVVGRDIMIKIENYLEWLDYLPSSSFFA